MRGKRHPGKEAGEGERRRRRGKLLVVLGISLILLGLLALAGVYAYIYFTDRRAARAQEELRREWEREPPSPESGEVGVGDGIARIIAPRIGLDAIVVELWGLDDAENLKRGPGHIPGTAYPGQAGNCVISGHRTTYGAPFRHIEQLTAGERITLVTASNRYVYEVYEQRVVQPSDLTVLEQGGDPKLTLTACHPWYSAAQRIVVIARLVESTPREG
ncbi:MAG: class E sortase [Actinomycetota bacterium]|nr:class E sortase [Actinomycetota bacterium]